MKRWIGIVLCLAVWLWCVPAAWGIGEKEACLLYTSMREREEKGRFTSLQSFCERMYGTDMNKRALENLILSGAFDSTGARRSQLHRVYEQVLSGVVESRRQNVEGQLDFFGGFLASEASASAEIPLPDIPEFTAEERMRQEKETTGPVSYTHLDVYKRQAVRFLLACGRGIRYTIFVFLCDGAAAVWRAPKAAERGELIWRSSAVSNCLKL